MTSRRVTLPATATSLTELLGIQTELRGSLKVRLQFVSGTVLYGSKSSQDMILSATLPADDLVSINGDDLHLMGPGVVTILTY